jgi:hypothetical protein
MDLKKLLCYCSIDENMPLAGCLSWTITKPFVPTSKQVDSLGHVFSILKYFFSA